MIIFLYGLDTYRSRQKLKEIIEEYKRRHQSGLNFIRINFDEKDLPAGKAGFSDFKQAVETVSMFDEKKLIILEDVFQQPENFQEDLREYLSKRNLDDNFIIFWAEKINPQNKLFRFLKKKAKAQEFNLLQPSKLKEWIKKYIKEQGGDIESQAIEKLVDYVGSDLWRMTNEINKLILFKAQNIRHPGLAKQPVFDRVETRSGSGTGKIQVRDVEELIKPDIDINIFNIIDALGQKNKKRALKLVYDYLKKGESDGYLLNRFIYQFRNLIKVKSGGGRDLHPFVFKKTVQQTKNFSFEELKKIYRKLLEMDLDIKTGRKDARTALEMFIANL